MTAARCRVSAIAGALGIVVWGLWRSGAALGSPPMRSWDEASRWYEAVGPGVAFVGSLRLVALAIALWLLIATASQLVAIGRGSPTTRRIANLIAPRSLQRFVHGLAGLSLSAGLAVATPGAGFHGDPGSGVAVMRLVEDPPEATGIATMHAVDHPPAPAAPVAEPVVVPTAAPDFVSSSTVVEPGDSLWSIAEETLRDAGQSDLSERAVASYWRRLIETNRGTLVAPASPDLIYAGQQITLPPLA
jgi:hypothetical protein